MADAEPRVAHEYIHHHLDSTRWRVFEPRPDDVVVTTSYKSGTTWMQQILHGLVFRGDPEAPALWKASPWLDERFVASLEEVSAAIAAQTHRRFLKSHLPLDGLPYYPQVKYVVVARDARDVFMSLWNHYNNYTDAMLKSLNEIGGEPFPHPPEDIHECWRNWITRGWFEWETEGWPFWSNLHHTRTYWEHRHLSNLLLVHYADLLADPQGQVRRVADFLDFELSPEELARTVRLASFDAMKVSFKREIDERFRQRFRGGTDAFLFKGTNGRWRDVLSDEDLVLYEEAKRRVLTPDCAEWLERGWLGSGV